LVAVVLDVVAIALRGAEQTVAEEMRRSLMGAVDECPLGCRHDERLAAGELLVHVLEGREPRACTSPASRSSVGPIQQRAGDQGGRGECRDPDGSASDPRGHRSASLRCSGFRDRPFRRETDISAIRARVDGCNDALPTLVLGHLVVVMSTTPRWLAPAR
jgi:hypothetical protein